jgi:hypothetical protein
MWAGGCRVISFLLSLSVPYVGTNGRYFGWQPFRALPLSFPRASPDYVSDVFGHFAASAIGRHGSFGPSPLHQHVFRIAIGSSLSSPLKWHLTSA